MNANDRVAVVQQPHETWNRRSSLKLLEPGYRPDDEVRVAGAQLADENGHAL